MKRLEALEAQHAPAGGSLFETTIGGFPEDQWWAVDGREVDAATFERLAPSRWPSFVLLLEDDDRALIPASPRPLLVLWA
jgi:hypothetical protein